MSESEIEEEMEKEDLQKRVQAKEECTVGGDIHTDLEEIVPTGEKHRRSKKAGENRNFTNVSNQIEKQINQLAKIGANVLTFARTPQNSSLQSRMLKEINASAKQLQRQITQIQKTVGDKIF